MTPDVASLCPGHQRSWRSGIWVYVDRCGVGKRGFCDRMEVDERMTHYQKAYAIKHECK
jgi:hypothetical protein